MKKLLLILLAVFTFLLVGCSNNNVEINSNQIEKDETSKILLAYFSRADENYNVGYIEKGNTEWVADFISEKVTIDETYKIERVTPYPTEYKECTDEAKKEQTDNARPKIKGTITDFNDYDIIFLGYPIWWGDIPMCVYTFIESYYWNGKIVIPFSTHEGSSWGNSLSTLNKKMKGATLYTGYNCRGAQAKNNQSAVNDWLTTLGL